MPKNDGYISIGFSSYDCSLFEYTFHLMRGFVYALPLGKTAGDNNFRKGKTAERFDKERDYR
jgi:hypothetical protein